MSGAVRVEKPWGYELVWEVPPDYIGRILHLKQGQRVWFESGEESCRPLVLCAGRMLLVFEDERGRTCEVSLAPGHLHEIPVRQRHRLIAVDDIDLVAVGPAGNDDCLRLEEA